MSRNDVTAKLVTCFQGTLQIDAGALTPVAQGGFDRLSADTSTVKTLPPPARGATDVTVRQQPAQAIEAPSAMPAAS
jgi:hypothetical protein